MASNTQPLLVAKFGGSSVADFQSMSNSAQIVLNDPQVRVVVLSASAGVTNLLIELSQGLAPTQREITFNKIKTIQDNILEYIANNSEVKQEIYSLLNSIHTLSETASLATSPALTDEMVCHGELMSTRLFSAILQSQQAPSKWFDVRDVMITDNHFGRAQPNKQKMLSQCKELLLPLLKEHIIVTQGFIGREDDLQRTTTLGRGGSDYTAALLGEALNVSRIDIWTDVPGIYTTDPRVVPSAKKIDEISFEETAEMAIFGAKILHPATLIPAIHAGIPVFVGSSKQPQDGGTIVSAATSTAPSFRAIAIRRNQTLLTLQSLKMLHAHGFLAEVFNILAKHKVSVDLITTSEVSVALTLDTTGSSTNGSEVLTKELLNELSRLGRIEVEKDLSLVAIIGNKLDQTPGISRKVFAPLDNISIRMACFGASNHNICLLVANDDANNATQILHETLFDNA